ncbi:MAG TPA: YetF domain-containing protein [Ardenticatenaceae bacterium]|nr:YetF domain-containing protein [Ardenticatenaceae bacterium]
MLEIWDVLEQSLALGSEGKDLNLMQMSLRALVIYLVTLILVRLGDKRFLGKLTAFDVILGIILGSVMSRAINGSAAFVPTLGAGLVLVVLHWGFAKVAFSSDRFGNLIKGHTQELVRDGKIQWDQMRNSAITEDDLREHLRVRGKLSDPGKVKAAYLERSGTISVIPAESEPRVIEVAVRDGVQVVRLEL